MVLVYMRVEIVEVLLVVHLKVVLGGLRVLLLLGAVLFDEPLDVNEHDRIVFIIENILNEARVSQFPVVLVAQYVIVVFQVPDRAGHVFQLQDGRQLLDSESLIVLHLRFLLYIFWILCFDCDGVLLGLVVILLLLDKPVRPLNFLLVLQIVVLLLRVHVPYLLQFVDIVLQTVSYMVEGLVPPLIL